MRDLYGGGDQRQREQSRAQERDDFAVYAVGSVRWCGLGSKSARTAESVEQHEIDLLEVTVGVENRVKIRGDHSTRGTQSVSSMRRA